MLHARPTEAARAIRKKLKYGNVHRQVRALTLLDAMLLNGDKKIRCTSSSPLLAALAQVRAKGAAVGIAKDEPLLERLRILVSDSMTDAHVKRKAIELFASWAANFRNEPGMQQLVSLRNQLPTKVRILYIPFILNLRNGLLPKSVHQPQKMNKPVLSANVPYPAPSPPPPADSPNLRVRNNPHGNSNQKTTQSPKAPLNRSTWKRNVHSFSKRLPLHNKLPQTSQTH